MINFFKSGLILCIIVVTSLTAQSQEEIPLKYDTSEVRIPSHGITTRVLKDKIILRWAPSDYVFWEMGNTHGYIIERIGGTDTVFAQLPGMPIKPWTQEEFQNVKDTSNRYLAVAMEMLYGGLESGEDATLGSNLQNSIMEQQNRHSYALMSADLDKEAARSLGFMYEDKDVKTGIKYVYRIRINHTDPDLKTDTLEVFIDFSQKYLEQAVKNCWVEAFDNEIKVAWTFHNSALFSAYDIERSSDKKTWKKLNTRPYLSSQSGIEKSYLYIDTLVSNNIAYYYRLRGYTAFGDMGLYSEIMTATPKDLTPPAPAFDIKAKDQGGAVLITWDAYPTEADHDGFYIGRSYLASGGFEKISAKLKKEDRAFLDFQPDLLENNYYAVITVDKSGNEAVSYVALGYIVDSLPPSPPKELAGRIDSTGFVRICWARGPEADIIGYRVYWANDTLSEFSQLTGDVLSHTVFYDSVNVKTLSEFAYYKLVAVDHRYNHSEYSKILALQKPDLVPPAAPVITKYNQAQLSVSFSWVNSVSDDVVSHRVERKAGDEDWKVLKTFTTREKQWSDKELTAGKAYSYRIVALDDANNMTYSKSLEITAIDRGLRADVDKLKIVTRDGKSYLEWTYGNVKDAVFVVYKQNAAKTGFEPIARLSTNEFSYQIQDITTNYGVRVMFSDGGESSLLTTN